MARRHGAGACSEPTPAHIIITPADPQPQEESTIGVLDGMPSPSLFGKSGPQTAFSFCSTYNSLRIH
jgi:hypothetical protein